MRAICTRDDMEAKFGATNVAQYAKCETGDGDTVIADRITQAIAVASARIHATLRLTNYRIPDSGDLDPLLVDVAADLATVWLYELHGSSKIDTRSGRMHHRLSPVKLNARMTLKDIREGKLKLDMTR